VDIDRAAPGEDGGMDLPIYLVSLALSLVLLYFIVRAAVLSALKAHSVWVHDGGLDGASSARAVQQEWRTKLANDASTDL